MKYNINEISSLLNAQLVGQGNTQVEWLLTDSRSLTFPETTLFFALRSEVRDGAQYIPQLYRSGVRNFVTTSLPSDHASFPGSNFLLVPDVLQALQQLAEHHRSNYTIPVISITGSNGKTIVKEWLSQLLSAQYSVTRSPKSYNSQIGVPLSLWLLDSKSQVGIFEAGISKPGEMASLQRMIKPTIGIFTNIGEAHQANFETYKQKCREKLQLFQDCEALIYNADDDLISKCIAESTPKARLLSWSHTNPQAYLYISSVEKTASHTSFRYTASRHEGTITIPFIDDASLSNAISCLAAGLYLGIQQDTLALKLASLDPVAMRLEVKQGINSCVLINDSYNSDLTSLEIALDFVNHRHDRNDRKFTLIISDIQQSGMSSRQLYQQVAHLLSEKGVHRVLAVGPSIGECLDEFTVETHHFETTSQLLASGMLSQVSNEIILVKGARSFHFDRLVSQLEMKVHQTILEVNLNALIDNLNHYRKFLQPHTKIVCMVKASAYGAGSVEIARTLQEHGVDYLAVAVADEGATLRKAGITQGIIVMNPELSAFKEMFQYDLEPEVYSFELLDALIKAARKEGITHWPVHIKLDTGMHRLGFHPENDVQKLVSILQNQQEVMPRSVFSHFVGSDGADFDAFTHAQFKLFDKGSSIIQNAFSSKILRHICNTTGIERFPQYHLDMVRLGLGLYGVNPFNNAVINNVSTLKTVILQLRDVPAHETVGYSRRGVLQRPSRIAAIPIGYADGLNRHLGRGNGYCLVNGQKAPYVGNICMDVCMIDVTGIPCNVGDTVEIFGDNLPVSVLSDILDTIPYEVLTSISERVPRVYYQD